MIHAAINLLASELNRHLKRTFNRTEDMVVVSNLLERDGTVAANIDNKVVVCLTRLDKELVPMSPSRDLRAELAPAASVSAPLHLNLYVMFVANYSGANYPEALKSLSSTLQFFERTPLFDHNTTPDLDQGIEKLTLDIENLDIQQLSNLWGVLRATYLPSVVYKVRLVSIDSPLVGSEAALVGPGPPIGGPGPQA